MLLFKRKIIVFVLLLNVLFSSFLGVALAQNDPVTLPNTGSQSSLTTDEEGSYRLLAPLGDFDTFTIKDENGNNIDCAFVVYLNIIIRIFLGISAVLAMVMIVVAGVQYMTTEAVSGKGQAKSNIINAVFGFVLALAAYVILNTINPALLNFCPNFYEAQITISPFDEPHDPIDGKYCKNPEYDAGASWPLVAAVKAVPNLPFGVTTNKGECAFVGNKDCTSLIGLNPSIINNIKSNCPSCHVIITGGTECWLHDRDGTHKPGSSSVDLRATTSLNEYVTGLPTFPKNSITITKNGVRFYAEGAGDNVNTTGAHWHVYIQ